MSSLSQNKEKEKFDREAEERRIKNLGNTQGDERRDILDRRNENNVEYVTFYIGKNLLGVPVESVQEVVPTQKVTPIPKSSENIRGLMNLRGQIITVMDLRTRLGLEQIQGHDPMNVIMRFGSELLSLEVDSVGDVLACSKTMLLPAPPTLEGHWKDICQQVLQMEKGLMLAVSIEKIFGFNSSKNNEENA